MTLTNLRAEYRKQKAQLDFLYAEWESAVKVHGPYHRSTFRSERCFDLQKHRVENIQDDINDCYAYGVSE